MYENQDTHNGEMLFGTLTDDERAKLHAWVDDARIAFELNVSEIPPWPLRGPKWTQRVTYLTGAWPLLTVVFEGPRFETAGTTVTIQHPVDVFMDDDEEDGGTRGEIVEGITRVQVDGAGFSGVLTLENAQEVGESLSALVKVLESLE